VEDKPGELAGKTALLTGAARRVGACIAEYLHGAGMNVVVHYRSSGAQADALCSELNARRPGTASSVQADLLATRDLPMLVEQVIARHGGLDALINNASSFYPTPLGTVTEEHWEELMGSNLKGPFFLSQAAAPALTERRGSIVNIVDIYAGRPLEDHPVYSIAKAGLAMATRALARELGPAVRVNGVAPGAILWPEQALNPAERTDILARTALGHTGSPEDIARTVRFLLADAAYITGQILTVDGGRSIWI